MSQDCLDIIDDEEMMRCGRLSETRGWTSNRRASEPSIRSPNVDRQVQVQRTIVAIIILNPKVTSRKYFVIGNDLASEGRYNNFILKTNLKQQ